MSGTRNNVGKLRWDLVDWSSTEEMLKVLEFGAIKYSPDNWKKGLNREEILESAQRHLIKLFQKEELDQESQLHHAGHIMCNMMFYLYHAQHSSFVPERNSPFNNNLTN